ncbi:ABC transporter permease [Ureibacillus acetophenoni]|uniref:ABC-2 type transport system permease protein n=1 Tax=Ureibacillus acetophenoni TaxID=614649 RepID=A0A285U4A2_9BACL|nr:ABC transporter permease [Ureibacillus acetophenoni]SOC36258.1 ABC-2 type transport system permease protein [Ureibacillus acetophenoni]
MMDILKTKFLLLARQPASFIVITIVICIFAFVLGLGQQAKIPIAVYSDIEENLTNNIVERLNELPRTQFTIYEEEEALSKVENGDVNVTIHLKESGFDLIIAPDYMEAPILQNQLTTIYGEIMQKDAILNTFPVNMHSEVMLALDEAKQSPSFQIQYSNFSNDESFIWDSQLQSLFGFTLYMVIYTVSNGVFNIVLERRFNIWDRLTISSISKTKIYLANLMYCFLLGYIQVALVLSIFHFGVGVNFYGGYLNTLLVIIPYLICIVALSIFIASISDTPGKFNAYMSVIAVPVAMLGGGFWPLEIVTSEIMQTISYISPIRYGMELLFGVTLHGAPMASIIEPISILLFMTVLLMGIGINLLEKKGLR